MWKRILTISLVVAIVLSLAACTKEAEDEIGLPSPQEIVSGVIENLDDIKTYQFDLDMTMDMASEADGEAFEMTMVMDGSGTLDLDNKQMGMDMTMNMAVTGEDEMEVAMEMYLIGDMMYMMLDVPEMEAMWMKSEMPEGYWEDMSQVEPQIELLEVAQVEVIGSERVGGTDCYVLQLTPDIEQLWQIVMQQAEMAGEMPDVNEEFFEEMFRSFSVKQWIAKDTNFLTKVEIDMAVELTPEAMGSPEEEGILTMDIAMVLLVHDYNQPVSIVLPPEAEEAVEMPMWY
jgi:hypothetical protein